MNASRLMYHRSLLTLVSDVSSCGLSAHLFEIADGRLELIPAADAQVLRPVLQRLTWGRTMPVALIGGHAHGLDQLREDEVQGSLGKRISAATGKSKD